MFNTKLKRTSLILIAVVLMLSVFSMTAFAEETELANDILAAPADEAVVAGAEDSAAEEVADEVADEDVAAEDVAADDVATEDVADEAVTEDKTTETVVDDGHDHDTETTGEDEGFGTSDIVSLIILGIVVIAIAVYCIVKREKVGKYFRSIKSEFKKIVWSPRDQVRKNTIVVIVVVVALAVVIALADLVFMKGITALSVLF